MQHYRSTAEEHGLDILQHYRSNDEGDGNIQGGWSGILMQYCRFAHESQILTRHYAKKRKARLNFDGGPSLDDDLVASLSA